jgi:hypothetical protein
MIDQDNLVAVGRNDAPVEREVLRLGDRVQPSGIELRVELRI